MSFASIILSLLSISLLFVSTVSAEYIVCATSDHSEACRRIGAATKSVKCLMVSDSVDCLRSILKKKAHFGAFTPEEAILASYYINDDVKVIAEVKNRLEVNRAFAFETVVVVGKNFTGGLSGLKGKSYCHPGFIEGRYWSDRILKNFEHEVIDHFEKNIHFKGNSLTEKEKELYALSSIFDKACRPGSWAPSDWWDKKLKREYGSLCAKCNYPSTCSYEPQARTSGKYSALKCLTEENGDVAYTALEYVKQFFNVSTMTHSNADEYRLLCRDGSTRPISDADGCSWIRQPWTVILSASSAAGEVTKIIGDSESSGWSAALRNLLVNGNGQLIFTGGNVRLIDYIEKGRTIPRFDPERRSISWCTISEREQAKCEVMATAALVHGTSVQITCSRAQTKVECLKRIHGNESDLTFIDTEMGFIARQIYNLTPAAFAETEKTGNYYGVVVTKETWFKRFKDLRNKKACFPRYNGLGWLSHVQNVRQLNLVPNMLCSDSRVVWNFFSEACAPGAMSTDINTFSNITPSTMCQACSSKDLGFRCEFVPESREGQEIEALKCLNSGDGDVAVLDFYIVKQYLESNQKDVDMENLNILCRDETIKNFNMEDPEECSISQMNGGEVMMRENLPLNEKRDIFLTLREIDDLFGHSLKQYPPTFRIYEPFEGEPGVLFRDHSVALVSIYDAQNEYIVNYRKLQNDMKVCYRDNSAGKIYLSLLLILSALIVIFIE